MERNTLVFLLCIYIYISIYYLMQYNLLLMLIRLLLLSLFLSWFLFLIIQFFLSSTFITFYRLSSCTVLLSLVNFFYVVLVLLFFICPLIYTTMAIYLISLVYLLFDRRLFVNQLII